MHTGQLSHEMLCHAKTMFECIERACVADLEEGIYMPLHFLEFSVLQHAHCQYLQVSWCCRPSACGPTLDGLNSTRRILNVFGGGQPLGAYATLQHREPGEGGRGGPFSCPSLLSQLEHLEHAVIHLLSKQPLMEAGPLL